MDNIEQVCAFPYFLRFSKFWELVQICYDMYVQSSDWLKLMRTASESLGGCGGAHPVALA